MTEEASHIPKRKPDPDEISFWSPWEIFFLGVYPAALSWWRMGNKRKAKKFLVIFAVMLLLREWLTIRNSLVELELTPIVIVVTFLMFGMFQAVLATLVKRDAQEFRESGKTPVPTSWSIMIGFFVAVTVPVLAINYLLYFLPVALGVCPFPRLQNGIYQVQLAQRTGLEKLFLSRNDLDCNSAWLHESQNAQTISGMETKYYELSSGLNIQDKPKFFDIQQNIYVFEQPITQPTFDQFVSNDPWEQIRAERQVTDISKYNLPVALEKAYCQDFSKSKECLIFLAHQKLMIRLSLCFDKGLDQTMVKVIQTTAQRLIEYTASP
jgi:hypothetical protein